MSAHTTSQDQTSSLLAGKTLAVKIDEEVCRTPSPSRSTTLVAPLESPVDSQDDIVQSSAQSLISSLEQLDVANGPWAVLEGEDHNADDIQENEKVNAEAQPSIVDTGRQE